jgi:hypothetical protein
MTRATQEFFARLDEQPQIRGGGTINHLTTQAEWRTRSPRRDFPRLDRCRNQLQLLTRRLEKEDLDGS